jgi:DNA-3-methyladenine glycosylase I
MAPRSFHPAAGTVRLVEQEVIVGPDGQARCPWGAAPADYCAYHDDEWGRPVTDETKIYEKLCLEGFQSGLSWLTILRKRENFRKAFEGFDIEAVARFGKRDVERLLGDAGIVRHRGKIEATVANARAVVALHEAGLTLAALLWAHEPAAVRPAPTALGQLPPVSPESTALSKELRRRGFRFVGPTTVYSTMESLGVVNDHLATCHVRDAVERERVALRRPALR